MIKTAGVVFDFYDDRGAFLREKLAGYAIPEAIQEATVYEHEELAGLPDNVFAAVITNGDECLRKYACVDKGNVLASTIYFLGHKNNFPIGAKTKIAKNLMAACRHFDVLPPAELVKVAAGKTLLRSDGAEIVVSKGVEKQSDLTGTSLMPITAGPAKPPRDKSKLAAIPVISDPYVNVTSHVVGPQRNYEELDASMYAMVDRSGNKDFPLQTMEQIKLASDFFEDQWKRLHPRTRHEFCVKVAARAEEVGMAAPAIIRKYGSTQYAHPGEIEYAVETRRQMWRDGNNEASDLLDELLEKRASAEITPEVFAETLFEIDKLASADKYYDKAVIDPWATTFGIEKKAEWRWVSGNDVLTEDELAKFVIENRYLMAKNFNEDLADELIKKPVAIFSSLPLPQQRVIARMAHQHGQNMSVLE